MDEDIKKLLEENLAMTRELQASVAKIRSYMMWQRVFSFMYFLLVVGPLILALIYLPPLIRPYLQQYNQILQDYSQIRGNDNSPTINSEIQKFLYPSSSTIPSK